MTRSGIHPGRRGPEHRLECHCADRPHVRQEVYGGAGTHHLPDCGCKRFAAVRVRSVEQARSRRGTRRRPRLFRHSQQRQGRAPFVHRSGRALSAAEAGPSTRVAHRAGYSVPRPRGRRHRQHQGARCRHRILHRRAIVFLISDFELPGETPAARAQLRRAMRQTNRRHDLIAVHVEDPRERELPNVGILALEDAETGETVEIDTASRWGSRPLQRDSDRKSAPIGGRFRAEGIDTLRLQTDSPYLPALQRFFKTRERRRT